MAPFVAVSALMSGNRNKRAPATVQPGRVTYSGLGSATLVEPEAAPVRSEAVQIDLSSATVSQPAQDVAHAAHDNLIRLDDNTLVDIGMTQRLYRS